MINQIRISQEAYIITGSDCGMQILKVVIIGAFPADCADNRLTFICSHHGKRFYRFKEDIYPSVEDIASNIDNFVVY